MKTVAIIGTGIAGMGAGYFLRKKYDVSFYEKELRAGGHTNTVTIEEEGRKIPIDTGFIVYNELTYPNLTRFFSELEIATQETSMSFSVQHIPLGLEYCGTGLAGLFAQRKNMLNPRFLALLFQINRFNQKCLEVLRGPYSSYSLGDYVKARGYGRDFLDLYLLPMSSAVWSTPSDQMLDFPAATLVRFFKNHGLLGLTTHLPWRTVTGGSRVYRDKVMALFSPEKICLGNPAVKISREGGKVLIHGAKGDIKIYDYAILACHADEALAILKDANTAETDFLSKFRYHANRIVLHTDSSVMPVTRAAWSSWNYRIQKNASGVLVPSTAYWMNSLQRVSQRCDYFVSVNDPGQVDPAKILWETEYTHPVFDLEAVQAQSDLPLLNQEGPVYFCGSYFRYGFHEDALSSALDAARALHGSEVWP